MTYSFVQQHARPARPKHNFHLARRRFARIKLQHSLPRCLFGKVVRRFLAEEEVEGNASATSGAASRRVALSLGDARDVQPRQGLRILGEGAV